MERNEEEGERGREEARLPSPTRTHTDSSDIPTSIFLNSHSRAHTHTHTRHPRIHIHRNSHYACTCAQVRLGNYRKLELGRYLTTQRVAVELLITLGLVRPEEWERLFCKCAIPTPAFLRPPRLGRRLTRPYHWCACVREGGGDRYVRACVQNPPGISPPASGGDSEYAHSALLPSYTRAHRNTPTQRSEHTHTRSGRRMNAFNRTATKSNTHSISPPLSGEDQRALSQSLESMEMISNKTY